jgi:ABC-type multidrug transport system fused ATPase/permease subunit
MKSVKMMGLSRLLTTLVQDQRVEEIHRMARFRWSIVAQNMVQNLPWFVAPALTFVIYAAQAIALGRPSIETTQAFTSLSIITLLTDPAAKLLSAIPSTAASTGCFERIQAFLLAAPRTDQRISTTPCSSSTMVPMTKPQDVGLGDVDMNCLPQDKSSDRIAGAFAVSADRLTIRPDPSADVILKEVSFNIPRKSLTMIVGQVASGKTTLLKAILGELSPECGGSIGIASRRLAFAAQTPWLPNTSIRKVITGPAEADVKFDHSWYSQTLYACALDRDISLLQEGDETLIGGASTVLSGGQKHRVALARAVYSRAPIMLLDDVLSALDANTQTTVMSRLFGESGLLRGRDITVLFVTHASQFYSHKIRQRLLW